MRIAVGSDHAGYYLKESLVKYLNTQSYEINNIGSFHPESDDDYPDYAIKVAQLVANGEAEKGVLVCGTGIGVSIAANKVQGIRAAVCHDVSSAKLARAHNNANIICFGARLIGEQVAFDCLDIFFSTAFLAERHQRRIEKISNYEAIILKERV